MRARISASVPAGPRGRRLSEVMIRPLLKGGHFPGTPTHHHGPVLIHVLGEKLARRHAALHARHRVARLALRSKGLQVPTSATYDNRTTTAPT